MPWTTVSAFMASDQSLIIAVGNDGQFRKMAEVIGLSHLADDDRYQTNAARVEHRGELLPILEEAIAKQSADHWIQVFEKAGVPCGPINDMAQAFAMEQTKARGMRFDSP